MAKKKKELPEITRLMHLCEQAGLKKGYIRNLINRIRNKAETGQKDCMDIIKEACERIPSDIDINYVNKLTGAFVALWNRFIVTHDNIVEKGPIETMLIRLCMTCIQERVNPESFPDAKEAEREAQHIHDEWLKTPLPEIGNITPEQAILQERKELHNPQKQIKFRIALTEVHPGKEIEKQAKELFYNGLDLLKQGKYKEAIAVFREHLKLNPQNYVVWQNIGLAYIKLLDKEKAEESFKKALEIKPDYEVAKNNLAITERMTEKQFKAAARDFKIPLVEKG